MEIKTGHYLKRPKRFRERKQRKKNTFIDIKTKWEGQEADYLQWKRELVTWKVYLKIFQMQQIGRKKWKL